MGKPTADVYIDDKAISAEEWKRSRFAMPARRESERDA